MLDSLIDALRQDQVAFIAVVTTRLEAAVAEVDKERTKGLAEVAAGLADVTKERTKGLAEVAAGLAEVAKERTEVAARREELLREIEAMRKHKEAQQGHVVLNIGGCRFETSVQTLRRVPQTFFDAYFSGRHAQDVCADGSIFVDRDGEHFGHVLEYMRDGHVSVAKPGARPSVSLLHALKREFGFYCIKLVAETPLQIETAYVVGGLDLQRIRLSSMERYDASSGQWRAVAPMGTAQSYFGACVMAGELYVIGGRADDLLSSVEKYSPLDDTWSAVASMPVVR
jgi:hypothetical protein